MRKIFLALVCLFFTGQGARIHQAIRLFQDSGGTLRQEHHAPVGYLNALATLLLTFSSTGAFRPSLEAVRLSLRHHPTSDSLPVVLHSQNRCAHRVPVRMSGDAQTVTDRRDAFKLLDGVEVLRVADGTSVALNQQWSANERCALFFFRSWG